MKPLPTTMRLRFNQAAFHSAQRMQTERLHTRSQQEAHTFWPALKRHAFRDLPGLTYGCHILPDTLAINASPDAAAQAVTVKVTEKSSGQAVSDAAVYVLIVTDTKSMSSSSSNEKRLNEADTVKEKGTLAGNSDESGQLVYNFSSSGRYLFAAFKDGYNPAFTYVNCTVPVTQNSLFIKAPGQAAVGDYATITYGRCQRQSRGESGPIPGKNGRACGCICHITGNPLC